MIKNSAQGDMNISTNEEPSVLNIKKISFRLIKNYTKLIVLAVIVSFVWTVFTVKYFMKGNFFLADAHVLLVIFFPWFLLFIWFLFITAKARKEFWQQLALMYKGEYVSKIRVSNEKGLLFNVGHSQFLNHGIKTNYHEHSLSIFEYSYVIGSGKTRQVFNLVVFRAKFKGVFPHIYLNCKNNWYSNPPGMFASLANISTPKVFEDQFKFYAPKEYEIETLQIFTPEIFQFFIDSHLDYDIELVDSELIFYKKGFFNDSLEFEIELNKIKKTIDVLSVKLDRSSLDKIGDVPFNF